MILTLYHRPGCHLCDETRATLARLVAEGLLDGVEEVDIERDEALHRRYLERIPVVAVGGIELAELDAEEAELREAIARVRR